MLTQLLAPSQTTFASRDILNRNDELTQFWKFFYRETFRSTMVSVLQDAMPLPPNAVFLGTADEDHLPVLLDVGDPDTGAILIAGKASTGKTALLQVVASGISYTHNPAEIEFAVITQKTWEWAEWENSRYCSGVFAPEGRHTASFIDALEVWMKRSIHNQTFLLFMDGLEMLKEMDQHIQQQLLNLLELGPLYKIWPIVTVNIEDFDGENPFLSLLKTRLLCLPNTASSHHECKYLMRENSRWLKFSIPSR